MLKKLYLSQTGEQNRGKQMKTYNLRKGEQLQDEGLWCVPLKEQPPEYKWDIDAIGWCYTDIPLQYPVGEIVGIKEKKIKWIKHIVGEGSRNHVLYYDTYGAHCKEPNCEYNKPQNAIRKQAKIVDNTVKQVQKLTIKEVCKILDFEFREEFNDPTYFDTFALVKRFIAQFNSKYAKPRPHYEYGVQGIVSGKLAKRKGRYKNKKIVRYECWCWDKQAIFDLANRNDDYLLYTDSRWKYKGLPLKVHYNPYVELPKYARVK